MKDYPVAMNNFEPLLRKKMIDIANALLANGYDDSQAIPIAISQAKDWYENATQSEKNTFKAEPSPTKHDSHEQNSNPDLLDENVEVFFNNNEWHVKTSKAKRSSQVFSTKKAAVERATEIAKNKNSQVITYTKAGKKQKG